jgi:hypothetical protein
VGKALHIEKGCIMTIAIPDDKLLDATLERLRNDGQIVHINSNKLDHCGESVIAFATFKTDTGIECFKVAIKELTRGGSISIFRMGFTPNQDVPYLSHDFDNWLTIGLPQPIAEFLLECLTAATWIRPAAVWKVRNSLSSEKGAKQEKAA